MPEIFPVVDETGKVIGTAERSVCHNGLSMLLHPVVHLHVLNSAGELYLQKRSMVKDIQPGKWDTAVGGHVDDGETINEALYREAREELGITDFEPAFVLKYIFKSTVERELVNVFVVTYDGAICPDLSELSDGKFWPLPKITSCIGKNIFTPNFEEEFINYLMPYLENHFQVKARD